MGRFMILLGLLFALVSGARGDGGYALIEGAGEFVPQGDVDPCPPSTLYHHHDGSTESAFTWGWPGVYEPDYGAVAEGYPETAGGTVCGVELYLSRWGSMNGVGAIDLFVWEYDAATDNPGNVLATATSAPVSGVANWPGVSVHDYAVTDAAIPPAGVFIGYWPRSFIQAPEQFGCAVDQNGPGGVPRTKIPAGGPWPSGWHHPSEGPLAIVAWGIGPWIVPGVIPVDRSSWGAVKTLYD